jgi:hypothetical protein
VQHGGGRGTHDLAVAGADDRGKLLPQPLRRRQVQLHDTARRHAQLGGSPTQHPDGIELDGVGLPTGGRGVGEERKVVAEELDRDVAHLATRASGDVSQPRVAPGAEIAASASPLPRAAVGDGAPLSTRCRPAT